jgi:hypothetical protein
VLRALRARRPQPRYLVGNDARGHVLFEALAPTAATDWAKSVATGLRTPPPHVARMLERLRGR